jgi:hypothetical protein
LSALVRDSIGVSLFFARLTRLGITKLFDESVVVAVAAVVVAYDEDNDSDEELDAELDSDESIWLLRCG